MADEPVRGVGGERPDLVLGGRYRLAERIGRGGMADVYAAHDELLHRVVAVKIFRGDGPEKNERRRVESEIRTLAGLRHPGLVTVFDAGVLVGAADEATPFLVMEMIHGQTLRHRLADGPLHPAQAARFGAELATTLAYVHAQGVVHRDVKPANILMDDEANDERGRYAAKLTDFGIARLVDATRMTTIGTTVGTANYLSPEQATGHATGPAGDVYSLGLVLLECLTGQLVYPGSGFEAAMARLHHQPVIPTTLGPEWVPLLTAMTDRDPDLRPPASSVARSLPEVGQQAEMHSHAGSPTATIQVATGTQPVRGTLLLPARSEPHRSTGTQWAWVAGAVALLAVVLTAVLVNAAHGSSPAPSSPAPSYPAVPGPIGTHLRQLEGAVG